MSYLLNICLKEVEVDGLASPADLPGLLASSNNLRVVWKHEHTVVNTQSKVD